MLGLFVIVARVLKPSPRLFVASYAALLLPPVLVLLSLSLVQEPLKSDLTRLGGFSEAEYGWNQAQERFRPPIVALQYDHPYDIVVLGDSFSVNPGGQSDQGVYWTNYLAQQTGFSVSALSVFDVTPKELLSQPIFIRNPPRVVILELVERYLIRDLVREADKRIGTFDASCEAQSASLPALPAWRPLPVRPIDWTRDKVPALDLDQSANYLWKAAARTLGIDSTGVLRLALTRSDLLSSRDSGQLLVHEDDLRKVRFTTDDTLATAHCKLVAVQNAIQRNGRTRFLFVPVPDKATAYSEYLGDPQMRNLSRLAELASKGGVNQVDLLRPLQQEIGSRVKDVYMPNDTHWSSTGHKIAAETVVRALSRWH
jgi:hypothetical protein